MPTKVLLETRGDGRAVLFLHGLPTPWDVLRPIAVAAKGHRTLLAALPGYGDAAPWAEATSAVGVAEAIEEAVRAAGPGPVSIVGFSGGAYHAVHVAVRGKVAVDRLVLLGGMAELQADEKAAFRGFAAALRAGQPLLGVATARFLSPAFAATHPDACARVESWLGATPPANLARELDAMAEAPSLLEGLGRFEGQLLARTGSLDVAVPVPKAEAMARAARNGRLEIVPGVGHALMEEDREGTIAAVLAALG
jgi:3-oxoadipate enol-lactonase